MAEKKKPLPSISPEHASSNWGGRYGPGSFKGTCTPFVSFFLELYTGLFFFHLGGGGQKKNTTPYFTRARFVQLRRTLRTRILQRYLYSICFFLSRTLHRSFLLSSRGWWTKKTTTPYFTRSRFVQPRKTLRIRILQRYYVLYFFLSFSNFTLVSCLFFFHPAGSGQKEKNHYPLFHQITFRPTSRTLRTRILQRYNYVPFSYFLSLLNLNVFWYL